MYGLSPVGWWVVYPVEQHTVTSAPYMVMYTIHDHIRCTCYWFTALGKGKGKGSSVMSVCKADVLQGG